MFRPICRSVLPDVLPVSGQLRLLLAGWLGRGGGRCVRGVCVGGGGGHVFGRG